MCVCFEFEPGLRAVSKVWYLGIGVFELKRSQWNFTDFKFFSPSHLSETSRSLWVFLWSLHGSWESGKHQPKLWRGNKLRGKVRLSLSYRNGQIIFLSDQFIPLKFLKFANAGLCHFYCVIMSGHMASRQHSNMSTFKEASLSGNYKTHSLRVLVEIVWRRECNGETSFRLDLLRHCDRSVVLN